MVDIADLDTTISRRVQSAAVELNAAIAQASSHGLFVQVDSIDGRSLADSCPRPIFAVTLERRTRIA